MNQDNEVLSAIRRQKAVYNKKLENTHNIEKRKALKNKIRILSEDENYYLNQLVKDI